MKDFLVNQLYALAFMWPYYLLLASYGIGVASGGEVWLAATGGAGVFVAILWLTFRELRRM